MTLISLPIGILQACSADWEQIKHTLKYSIQKCPRTKDFLVLVLHLSKLVSDCWVVLVTGACCLFMHYSYLSICLIPSIGLYCSVCIPDTQRHLLALLQYDSQEWQYFNLSSCYRQVIVMLFMCVYIFSEVLSL